MKETRMWGKILWVFVLFVVVSFTCNETETANTVTNSSDCLELYSRIKPFEDPGLEDIFLKAIDFYEVISRYKEGDDQEECGYAFSNLCKAIRIRAYYDHDNDTDKCKEYFETICGIFQTNIPKIKYYANDSEDGTEVSLGFIYNGFVWAAPLKKKIEVKRPGVIVELKTSKILLKSMVGNIKELFIELEKRVYYGVYTNKYETQDIYMSPLTDCIPTVVTAVINLHIFLNRPKVLDEANKLLKEIKKRFEAIGVELINFGMNFGDNYIQGYTDILDEIYAFLQEKNPGSLVSYNIKQDKRRDSIDATYKLAKFGKKKNHTNKYDVSIPTIVKQLGKSIRDKIRDSESTDFSNIDTLIHKLAGVIFIGVLDTQKSANYFIAYLADVDKDIDGFESNVYRNQETNNYVVRLVLSKKHELIYTIFMSAKKASLGTNLFEMEALYFTKLANKFDANIKKEKDLEANINYIKEFNREVIGFSLILKKDENIKTNNNKKKGLKQQKAQEKKKLIKKIQKKFNKVYNKTSIKPNIRLINNIVYIDYILKTQQITLKYGFKKGKIDFLGEKKKYKRKKPEIAKSPIGAKKSMVSNGKEKSTKTGKTGRSDIKDDSKKNKKTGTGSGRRKKRKKKRKKKSVSRRKKKETDTNKTFDQRTRDIAKHKAREEEQRKKEEEELQQALKDDMMSRESTINLKTKKGKTGKPVTVQEEETKPEARDIKESKDESRIEQKIITESGKESITQETELESLRNRIKKQNELLSRLNAQIERYGKERKNREYKERILRQEIKSFRLLGLMVDNVIKTVVWQKDIDGIYKFKDFSDFFGAERMVDMSGVLADFRNKRYSYGYSNVYFIESTDSDRVMKTENPSFSVGRNKYGDYLFVSKLDHVLLGVIKALCGQDKRRYYHLLNILMLQRTDGGVYQSSLWDNYFALRKVMIMLKNSELDKDNIEVFIRVLNMHFSNIAGSTNIDCRVYFPLLTESVIDINAIKSKTYSIFLKRGDDLQEIFARYVTNDGVDIKKKRFIIRGRRLTEREKIWLKNQGIRAIVKDYDKEYDYLKTTVQVIVKHNSGFEYVLYDGRLMEIKSPSTADIDLFNRIKEHRPSHITKLIDRVEEKLDYVRFITNILKYMPYLDAKSIFIRLHDEMEDMGITTEYDQSKLIIQLDELQNMYCAA